MMINTIMTISLKVLNDQIKVVSETNTLLDMLLEFEKTLDSLNLYAFKNWSKGEVLEGPTLSRHYINVKLLYVHDDMPDPAGAERLMARECLVKYTKDTLISPKRGMTADDVTVDVAPDGRQRYKAKTNSTPCWVVSIDMPRKYVDEFADENVQVDDENYLNQDDMGNENQIDVQQMNTSNNAMGGVDDFALPQTPLPGAEGI